MKTGLHLKHRVITWFLVLCTMAGSAVVHGGPLLDKARVFDEQIQAKNCVDGMVFNMRLDASGNPATIAGDGDSSIWTGAYVTSQAFRYQATRDPVALKNIERSLYAFHVLQAVTGYPGFAGRSFGDPRMFPDPESRRRGVGSFSHLLFNPDTSRDQYTGLFLAYSVSWPLIQNDSLRETVRKDVLAIGRNLVRNDLSLVAKIDGRMVSEFNLNPTYVYQDRINAHEWKVVDDFPVNEVTKIIPFNEITARALATFMPPPIRGGEALRAILMLKTAAMITGDTELVDFYQRELLEKRMFVRVASETSQIVEEIFKGKGGERVKAICGGLFVALIRVGGEVLAAHRIMARPLLKMFGMPLLFWGRPFGESVGGVVCDFFAWLNRPGAFALFTEIAPQLETISQNLEFIGLRKLAKRLKKLAVRFREIGDSSTDQLCDALRSYVGTNLTFFALLGIMQANPDPEMKLAGESILARAFQPVADEGNSMYTYIRAAFNHDPLSREVLDAAKRSLLDYPLDQRGRYVDHSKDSGIRFLTWPDRFGKYDQLSVNCFTMSERGPHIFIWQESPRSIAGGESPDVLVAPVGYLMAYWLGRAKGLISESD
ncbi:MAG: hypothetical protein HQM09_08480 [Candidatus Riflebacteria bacterium]|nr:hypothetical protein [Candidatus Riflebacteria bacterium]